MTAPSRPRGRIVATTALALVAVTAAGCTSSYGAKHATTSSTSGAVKGTPSTDQLKATLITPDEITGDKFTLTNTSPVSQSGAVGISGVFANASHDRVISVILIHYPTAAYAQAGLTEIQNLAAGQLTRNPASETPVQVGQGAQLYQGANATGPLSILVFAEGNYNVTMEYVSKHTGDDVPAATAIDLGKKQDIKVKAAG